MSWREAHPRVALAMLLLVAGAVLADGCRHGERDTIRTQPFRDESDPSDFQFYESATPAEDATEKSGESGGSSETTVEVDIDDEESAGDEGSAAAGSSKDEDDEDSDEGDDEGEGDDEPEGEGAGASGG